MMKRVLIYGVLFWVLGCYKAASQEAIGLYDLHYTLETDLSTPKGRNVAWDDVHVVSALQGIVNRDAPQLYVFFVDRDQLDIDKYWLNKYRRKGQWLYQKETVTYNTIEDLVSAYAGYIKGVVLYDERVPSTSNVASAVAGAEDLLPIRYDLDSESLYSRLVLGGPRLKVKRRLINEDGSVMFTGSGGGFLKKKKKKEEGGYERKKRGEKKREEKKREVKKKFREKKKGGDSGDESKQHRLYKKRSVHLVYRELYENWQV